MIRILMILLVMSALLACGTLSQADTQANDIAVEVSSPTSQADTQADDVAVEVSSPTPQADKPVSVQHSVVPEIFHGDTLLEEKIIDSDAVVRATMTSLTSEVVIKADGRYAAVLKFSLKVSEYLKGTGPSSIVAVWLDGRSYELRKQAEAEMKAILAERDSQWDGREAIIFLHDGVYSGSRFGTALDEQLKRTDHFLLYVGDPYSSDDLYSLHSRERKRWLPAAQSLSAVSETGSATADRKFLLDVPSPSGDDTGAGSTGSTTPTITLVKLKKLIGDVTTEFNGGDGSEAYKQCVEEKYKHKRAERYFKELDGGAAYDKSPVSSTVESGQAAGTVLHQRQNYGDYPDRKAKTWFEGTDAALLAVLQGDATPYDIDGDGKFTAVVDGIEFTEKLTMARPLPSGDYSVVRREVWATYLACNFVLDNNWTITVTAPGGTLHEMFFDPVTVGTTVAADATNGVLRPKAFTTASGTATTISRIAYEPSSSGSGESAQVKIEVTPDDALSGQVVDFIGLDGKVSLTLSVAAATVDAANDTLSWPVSTQPWKAGDKLMVRIGPAPPAPAAPTGLTAASGNASVTLVWNDPSNATITGYEYRMRWTGVGWQDWVAVPSSGASTSSYAATGLTNGTEYRFKVRAINAGGAGRTGPSADPWYVAATPQTPTPTAPTGLTATAGKGSVTLTWDDPSNSSITRYEYRMRWTGVGWQGWVAIPNSGAATASHKITGLTNGTEHRFQVRAVNAAGAGKAAPNAHPWYVSATP